jgi:hypothetical protein
MWKVEDEDRQHLEEHFYRSMSFEEGSERYYERTARALQYAVQLMRPSLPLMRWVNFVHYGA